MQNEAHVGNVSVKLHSSVALKIFQIFRKQGTKLTLFMCVRRRLSCAIGAFLLYYCDFVCYFIGDSVVSDVQI